MNARISITLKSEGLKESYADVSQGNSPLLLWKKILLSCNFIKGLRERRKGSPPTSINEAGMKQVFVSGGGAAFDAEGLSVFFS